MKDTQYFPGPSKSWNGGIMSGGGGGLPSEGRGAPISWTPSAAPPPLSHHQTGPRMMNYFGSPQTPAAAHLGRGWVRGMKPSESLFTSRNLLMAAEGIDLSGGGRQGTEGGMDLSSRGPNPVSNGGLNGQFKESVSVIAPNPLRLDKSHENSDKSDDDDEDCMVIEEGEDDNSGDSSLSASQLPVAPAAHSTAASTLHPPPRSSIVPPTAHSGLPVQICPLPFSRPVNQLQSKMSTAPLSMEVHSESVHSPADICSPVVKERKKPLDPPLIAPKNIFRDSGISVSITPSIPSQSGQQSLIRACSGTAVPATSKPPAPLPPNPNIVPVKSPAQSTTISASSGIAKLSKTAVPLKESNVPLPAALTKEPPVVSTPEPKSSSPATPSSPGQEVNTKTSADHVESLLENMFQQEETPIPHPVIVPNSSRAAPLTEDKVVAILEESEAPIKSIKEEKSPGPKLGEQAKGNHSTFMEVESELAKMFEGIVEPSDVDGTSIKKENVAEIKKPAKRKLGRPRRNDTEKKKKKTDKGRKPIIVGREKIVKDGSNDSSIIGSMKSRGPYLKVVGSRDNPVSVMVVNSGVREEEEKDRPADKIKKKPRIVEGRVKGPGLYSSTLSSKYNSLTVDPTWTCIFCKKRSHCEGGLGGEAAGDLFGPYSVTLRSSDGKDGGPSDIEVSLEQRRRGGGKGQSIRAAKALHSFTHHHAKKAGKAGIVVKLEESGIKEVWTHEKCAVWAEGIIMVGSHLLGLDEAVSSALTSKCTNCDEYGASIGCLNHSCSQIVHYGCAVSSDWSLDEDSFHSYCPQHKKAKPITLSMLKCT